MQVKDLIVTGDARILGNIYTQNGPISGGLVNSSGEKGYIISKDSNGTVILKDGSGNSCGSFQDSDTKYSLPAASSNLGGVKSGGDVTIIDGVITVNDDSHTHDGRYYTEHEIDAKLDTKADFASPVLTGTPTAPTPAPGTNSTQIANAFFVRSEIDSRLAANDAMLFKGTIGSSGATVTALPATHNAGWTYRVITAGTYAGVNCEIGDMIICITDGTAENNAHWTVVQTNTDGVVIGPDKATSDRIATFSGTTGKIIKDSGYTIATSVPANAVFTDTHYETKLFATNKSGTAHAATTNGDTYLRLFDNSTARQSIKITGSGATSVTSDANGVITISSTNTTYGNFIKSGSGAQAGLVPAPSTTAGTTKYLREDGTWAVPPDTNTTYTFNGAISTIKDSNLTTNRALISNDSGKVDVSYVTSTELGYLDGVTSNIQKQLDKKANDYSIELYNGTRGNPKPVRFASFDYSTCVSEEGIAAKIGMVSGHGNGSSYAFMQDAIIRVNYQGTVSVDNFKYYGADAGTYDGAARQYGDIFWLVDTTNKIVDFYCLMGQYARVNQTPWKRLTYSSKGTVTQYTSATVYSSGEKVWANNSDIALKKDVLPRITSLESRVTNIESKAITVYSGAYTDMTADLGSDGDIFLITE